MRNITMSVPELLSSHLWVPADVAAIRVKAFILYDKVRHDIKTNQELFSQMTQFDDWTSLDRLLLMSMDASSLSTTDTIPD
jgi:hypothetical protein